MWPQFNLDRYRDFLQDILSHDDLAPEFVRRNRRICEIIKEMTADERRTVLPALAKSNIERIARESAIPEVDVATFLTWYVSHVHGFNFQSGIGGLRKDTGGTWLSLCARAHAKMVAGTCPWCGNAVANGRIAS